MLRIMAATILLFASVCSAQAVDPIKQLENFLLEKAATQGQEVQDAIDTIIRSSREARQWRDALATWGVKDTNIAYVAFSMVDVGEQRIDDLESIKVRIDEHVHRHLDQPDQAPALRSVLVDPQSVQQSPFVKGVLAVLDTEGDRMADEAIAGMETLERLSTEAISWANDLKLYLQMPPDSPWVKRFETISVGSAVLNEFRKRKGWIRETDPIKVK